MELPNKNVMPDSSPAQVEEPVVEAPAQPTAPVITPEVTPAPAPEPVAPAESMVPLSALEQERTWRKDWEQKYKTLEASNSSFDPSGLNGGELESEQIKNLGIKLQTLEKKEQRREVETKYPVLVDKKTEFDEFLSDTENAVLSMEKAAKLFLAENGLLKANPKRVGLEQPTGGTKTPPATGISKDDIKRIRETEPRKYIQMLREGKINPDDI